ncbi:Syntaxin 18 [Giardia lamblia P15]|uniref:Syntaxin 18 n=1 Tax=Giardia intestinalis (strain P15) TaxID=658858 RepID=E1F725_GIAIA|nr:Syntaxin 18 [Giardia lamblia P15]
MPLDFTGIFHQLLGTERPEDVKISPSPMHNAFSTARREVLSLRDIVIQNSSNYTAATLSSNTCSVEGMPFTDEECALFDARILTIFTHINGLVGNILKELEAYAAKESGGDEFDTEENALEVLERQLRRDNSKNAIQYFEGVGNVLLAQVTQIFEDYGSLRAKRRAVVSSDYLRERSQRHVYALNMQKDSSTNMSSASNTTREESGHGNAPMDHTKGLTGIWATVHAMDDEDHASQVSQSQMGTSKTLATRRILPSLMEELDIVRRTEQTAHEIQSLNALFAEKVIEQSEQIDRIYAVTFETSGTLENANKYLKKAAKRLRSSTKITIVLMCLAIFCLLFLDYIN